MPKSKLGSIVLLTSLAMLVGLALAQEEDLYKFMPQGGRQLLVDVVTNCANCDDMVTIVSSKKTEDEWQKYFTGKQSKLPNLPDAEKKKGAFANLTDKQIKTLVTYLFINMPMAKEKLPKDPKTAKWVEILPLDGRQLVLEYCMACHGIAITVLQTKELEGWMNTFRAPVHTGIKLSEQQWKEMANYLAINMPVPEDQIPAELKKPPEY